MYEKLSKRALSCMYTAGIITGAIILAVIAAVDYFWIFPEDVTIGKWISLILAVLILFDVVISPYFRYHRYRYSINDECIDIIEGYLFVKRNIVPIERIHKIQTKKGPVDQIFRVAKVIVTTGGGDVTLSFLEDEKAERIAESLRKRINEIVLEQREVQSEIQERPAVQHPEEKSRSEMKGQTCYGRK
ncbi:MAG TPA: PH domain-containing protein [Candidatus Mediterraneibacter ornithocaccae]|nr:PH domain-containing protein [Candidatus Mediterraneibacter ornithocaccae]